MPTFNGFNTDMFQAAVVDGTTAATSIAVTGLATDDVLLLVLHQDSGGLFSGVLTDETSITAAGVIETSTTDTSNDKLLVVWLDVSQTEN